MLIAQATTTDGATALATAVVVGLIYLVVVRFLDLNEKEPLWTTAMVFAFGAIASTFLHLTASSRFLELELVGGVVLREAVLFAAIAAGVGVLTGVGRLRGWMDINGLMDGVVYGAAGGLGFATGTTFVRELVFGGSSDLFDQGPLEQLWPIAVAGLALGVFGAIIGAGFGLAVTAREQAAKFTYPLLGFVVATLAHLAYQYTRAGTAANATGIKLVAFYAPIAAVLAVIIFAIVREQRAIAEELADEAEAGVVSDEELALLGSFAARRAAYMRLAFSGDFDGWMGLRELHNRQVQLALTERRLRLAGGSDPEIAAEVGRIRASVLALKSEQSGSSSAAATSEA